MISFFHNYLPQPILFNLGSVEIHWYGLLIVTAMIAGLLVAIKLAGRLGIKSDEVVDLGFYLIVFSVVGARIYAVLLFWQYYWHNPFEIVAVWHGGLAIHGAIIGGIATLLIYCWKKRYSFWFWADIGAVVLALGQTIGRWGNYFNQENFGLPTNLPWGIPISPINRPPGFEQFNYFQPTFLYESGLDLLNFAVLVFLFCRFNKRKTENRDQKTEIRKQRSEIGEQKTEKWRGLVFLIYLFNYSLIRILMEFFRIDVTPLFFGIRWPIAISIMIMIFSFAVILFKFVFKAKTMHGSVFQKNTS